MQLKVDLNDVLMKTEKRPTKTFRNLAQIKTVCLFNHFWYSFYANSFFI